MPSSATKTAIYGAQTTIPCHQGRKPCTSVSFGAFRTVENDTDSHLIENRQKILDRFCLTGNVKRRHTPAVAKTKKIPSKVAFLPSPEEKKMIQVVQEKYGLTKATEVMRMGLKQLADECVKSVG